MNLAGKNALVLGLGETGLSMARFLTRRGARVRVADTREAPPGLAALGKDVPQAELDLGAYRDTSFAGIDLLAISPGVPLATPQVRAAAARGVPVVGDIELFAQALRATLSVAPAKAAGTQLLAVTGTNGKTTVSALTGAMCRRGGLATEVAGNISPAVLDALMHCEDLRHQPEVWVLELSSFQLETTRTLNPAAATVLNISEDHLDRYEDMDAYARAKARIFMGEGIQVLNRDDARSMRMAVAGRKEVSFGLDAPGRAGDFGLLRVDGELWLAQGKGQDFSPLAPAVSRHARAVILIGRDAELIARALVTSGAALLRAGGMEQAVTQARAQAQPGDVVLLSPACASFDMFRNYPHRGEVFAECARKMAHAQLH